MRRRLWFFFLPLWWSLTPPPKPTVERGPRMASRVCDRCSRNWPTDFKYKACPYCQVETKYTDNKVPMTGPIAAELVNDREEALRSWQLDWTAAESVAETYGLDVADVLVAKRKAA